MQCITQTIENEDSKITRLCAFMNLHACESCEQ